MGAIVPRLGRDRAERRGGKAGQGRLGQRRAAIGIAAKPCAEASMEAAVGRWRMIDGVAWHGRWRAPPLGPRTGKIERPGRHLLARRRVMEDADDGRALRPRLLDHLEHAGPVGRIERGRRLVEQQDRRSGGKAAGDIDPLLLAAGEGDRRQVPEGLRNGQALEQPAGPGLGAGRDPRRARSAARRRCRASAPAEWRAGTG